MSACRPYPGLRPFDRDEDRLFFGRERQVDELLDRLGETHFIAVLGTSGSGKSSLVRAGMLPALEGGLLARAGARWQIAELRPGDRPLHRLAAALVQQTEWGGAPDGDTVQAQGESSFRTADPTDKASADPDARRYQTLEADLRKGPMALNWLLGLRPLGRDGRLLILVDQFEELFRFADEGDAQAREAAARESGAFVALLLESVRHPCVYCVLTMRSDFLGDCARHPGLPEAINAGFYLTPRLAPEQMAEAIALPARVCGGEAEPALVARLMEDARGETDQLPLLQHALMRLWDRAEGELRLTLAEYDRHGGLARALDAHAEETFAALADEAERQLAQTLFRSLAGRGENGRDTRRPARVAEVADLAGVEPGRVIAVADAFRAEGRSFLMPPPPGMEDGQRLAPDSVLDIAHEALIRQWQRLAGWAQAEADESAIYRRLELDACRRRDKGEASFWGGAELQLARPWLADLDCTRRWALRYAAEGERSVDLALGFLEESAKAEDLARKAKESQARRELQRARRRAIAAGVGFLVMAGLAGVVYYGWSHSYQVEQRRTSELFESKLTHAALLARTEDYAGARERLKESRALDGQIPAATRRLARDLLARYAEIMGGNAERVYTGTGAHLVSVAASPPDGRLIAACGERGTVVLFNTLSGDLVQQLKGHDPGSGEFGMVMDLVFHPKGDWLASAGEDRRIMLWTLPTADKPAALLRQWEAPDAVTSLAVSPDGGLLASGGDDNAISLWDTGTGNPMHTMLGHSARISENNGLAFSPDGTKLASASYDGTARIWDTKTGAEQAQLIGHQRRIQGVAFTTDSARVITNGVDGRVIVWDAKNGTQRGVYTGHANMVLALGSAERPDEPGSAPLLVAAGFDRSVRILDRETTVTLRLLQGHDASIRAIAIREGALYTAADDGTVRHWPLALPHQRLMDLPGEPESAAIAPDGRSVAVGFADGSLRLWGLPDLEPIAEVAKAHDLNIKRLAFSRTGNLLASAGLDNLARLWRIGPDGKPSRPLELAGHENAVNAVAFSPDGRSLATAGADGRIGLFDTATGKGRFVRSTQGQTLSVAFDHTGTRVVAADQDESKVRIWSVASDPPTLVAEHQAGSSGQLDWSEPNADGSRIAAVGRDQLLTILDAATGRSLAWPGHENMVFKARFLPGGQQVATASADATVRLWDLDTRSQLFALRLPADRDLRVPLWDFDLRCTAPGQGSGTCWLAVPLVRGKLAVYDLGPLPAGLAP